MAIPGPHKRWKYDLHPSVAMAHSIIAGMKEKTGRSIDEWVRHIKKNGPAAEKERAAWLKKEHGLGTNYASWIAGKSVGKNDAFEDADQYLRHAEDFVEKMYTGPKAHLRPRRRRITVFDDGSDLSQSRNRADQAGNANAHRPWAGVRRCQNTEAPDRHGRFGQERQNHSSHRDRQRRRV
jgi:hypothetical protein